MCIGTVRRRTVSDEPETLSRLLTARRVALRSLSSLPCLSASSPPSSCLCASLYLFLNHVFFQLKPTENKGYLQGVKSKKGEQRKSVENKESDDAALSLNLVVVPLLALCLTSISRSCSFASLSPHTSYSPGREKTLLSSPRPPLPPVAFIAPSPFSSSTKASKRRPDR